MNKREMLTSAKLVSNYLLYGHRLVSLLASPSYHSLTHPTTAITTSLALSCSLLLSLSPALSPSPSTYLPSLINHCLNNTKQPLRQQ
jgi:hypothetical protein